MINQKILLPFCFIKRIWFWIITDKTKLPGNAFYYFGKSIAKKLLLKGLFSPKLFLNPVSIVRFFEFEFAIKNLTNHPITDKTILDISSPYLFGFHCATFLSGKYTYINPDLKDLNLVRKYSSRLKFKMEFNTDNINATKLPYSNKSFDSVVCISVIEHIDNNQDSKVIQEIWRVLKPGGIVIFTFPVAKQFEIEYSESDTYGLNANAKKDKYFFQRLYDENSVYERLLNYINDFTILDQQIFGEIESGFYRKYSERWKSNGLLETVKDPYYISKHFTYIDSFNDIKESAVIGLTLRKNK